MLLLQNYQIFDTVFKTTVYVTHSKTVNFTAVRLKKQKSCIKYGTENGLQFTALVCKKCDIYYTVS